MKSGRLALVLAPRRCRVLFSLAYGYRVLPAAWHAAKEPCLRDIRHRYRLICLDARRCRNCCHAMGLHGLADFTDALKDMVVHLAPYSRAPLALRCRPLARRQGVKDVQVEAPGTRGGASNP